MKQCGRNHTKRSVGILLLLMLSFISACGAADNEAVMEQQAVGDKDTVITEDFSMPQKKINPTRYSELPLAAEELGFDFYSLKEFSNGYQFSSFDLGKEELLDYHRKPTGEFVNRVKLIYKHSNGVYKIEITAYPVDEEPAHDVLYEWTEEIEGTEVSLNTYILRLVLDDYELTEEDWAFMDSGKGSYSSDGVTEGEFYHYTLYFVKNGIYYEFYGAIEEYLPLEEFEGMVAEFLQSAKLQTAR